MNISVEELEEVLRTAKPWPRRCPLTTWLPLTFIVLGYAAAIVYAFYLLENT